MSALDTQATQSAFLWAFRSQDHGYESMEQANNVTYNSRDEQLTWVHLRFDLPGAHEQMLHFGLEEEVVEALTADETRPRMLNICGGILLILRGINTNPQADPEDMISLRIWFTDNFIITARKHDRKLLSIEDLKVTLSTHQRPKTIGDFITILVEKIADRVGEMVDHIDEELTFFEENLLATSNQETRRRLSVARRQAASIRRHIAPQRDALDALYRTRGILSNDDAFTLREQTDRTTRYVEDLDLGKERAIVLNEELRSQISEQQNVRVYILSMISAIFLPLSFLTGVFGMNVAGLPGTENAQAFIYLSSVMGVLAVCIMVAMLWRKWI